MRAERQAGVRTTRATATTRKGRISSIVNAAHCEQAGEMRIRGQASEGHAAEHVAKVRALQAEAARDHSPSRIRQRLSTSSPSSASPAGTDGRDSRGGQFWEQRKQQRCGQCSKGVARRSRDKRMARIGGMQTHTMRSAPWSDERIASARPSSRLLGQARPA